MPPKDDSIERLKQTLYSRDEKVVPKETRTPVSQPAEPAANDVPKDWGVPKSFDLPLQGSATVNGNNRFFRRFLVGSLIFFSAAVVISLFIFFGGLNMISSNNVDIAVTAPTSVSSGEETDLGLALLNQNSTDLLGAILYIDYPAGVQAVGTGNIASTSPLAKPLTHDKVDMGDIAKGAEKQYTLRTLIFGQKDEVKTFTFRLEYQVKGSNATFSKEKKYDVTISSSPLILNVAAPTEINSGQTVTLSIDLSSNSPSPVQNSLIQISYPYGFTYKDSNIKPLANSSVWALGDLKGGDKKTLTVKGTLVGQDMEDRTFQISAGVGSSPSDASFDAPLATAQATVGIRKSFFDLSLQDDNGGVLPVGRSASLSIQYQNTLPDKLINNHIEAVISGNVFDKASVSAGEGGFYRSADSTVLWDKNSTQGLDTVSPGDAGHITFSVSPISDVNFLHSVRNPHIDVAVTMTGTRTSDSSDIVSTANLTLKIPSTLTFSSKVHRDTGPFANTGPIPPKVDKESTYTVTWTLLNTTNDLSGATVSATLPAGVAWKEQISPVSEKVQYNADTRTITWNAGSVSAGAGFTISPREVSFQLGLTPSANQIGTSPTLLSEAEAVVTDTYTNSKLDVTSPVMTTEYSDTTYRSGYNIVGK